MKKETVLSVVTYILGLIILPLGVALVERADVGVSMIVAPAYVVYRFVSASLPFFTFGMAEYILQTLLLISMMIVLRKFRVTYLFSFVTVLLYGGILDLWMIPMQYVPADVLWIRLLLFAGGLMVTALGVSLFFYTTIPPEVYELFVKEIATAKGISLTKFKRIYDYSSCAAGILLSFLLFGFGQFVGIQWGTVVAALLNSRLIGLFSKGIGKIMSKIDG